MPIIILLDFTTKAPTGKEPDQYLQNIKTKEH